MILRRLIEEKPLRSIKALLLFILPAVSLISSVASADDAQDARAHYQKATAHFAVGEFAEAAVEYQAAYKAKPDPALLYDAAQAYRLSNNPEKALILYRNYLQLYPGEPNAAEVRAQIDKVREAISAAEKAKSSPPTGTNEPRHLAGAPAHPAPFASVTAAPPPAKQAAVSDAQSASASAERPTPLYRKWWLWTVVGVVVAGGVVTAAVLATQPRGRWSEVPDVGPGAQSSSLTAVRW